MRFSRPSLLPVCPCLALPMSLLLIAALAGCGPASSENASSPRTDLFASAASSATTSPAPLASENKTGSVPASSTKPANPMDYLEVPAWFAKDLASADVHTRLRALETWVLISPVGSIDPLILAYGTSDDERVQARAMELIEQGWDRAADFGQ